MSFAHGLIEEKVANLLNHATSLAIPGHSFHALRRRAAFPVIKKKEIKISRQKVQKRNEVIKTNKKSKKVKS